MTEYLKWWGTINFVAVLAVYGAVLASLVALWNWRRGRRDKGIVKISARIGMVRDDPRKAFIATATNIGRRPITFRRWCYSKKGNPSDFTLDVQNKNVTRNESEEYGVSTHALSFLNDDLAAIYVLDTTGKKWKVRKEILQRLIEDAKAKT